MPAPALNPEVEMLIDRLRALHCAVCVFQPADVAELIRENADAAQYLVNNRNRLEERMTEAGFEALQTYVSMDEMDERRFYFEVNNESGTGKYGTFPEHHPDTPCSYIHAKSEEAALEALRAAGLNVTSIEDITD